MLLAHHKTLIFLAEALSFFDQPLDRRIAQVVLVEPGNLREHLQVAVVAVSERYGGAGRLRSGGEHPPIELAIARVAPNHPLPVRLEQISQRKVPLIQAKFRSW